MTRTLIGTWRSFFLSDGPPELDGIFRLEEIDEKTGEITKGFHDLSVPPGSKPQSLPLTAGQVTQTAGMGYSIVMEHFVFGDSRKKQRYEGVLAFDSNPTEDRQVIAAVRTQHPAFAPANPSTEVEAAVELSDTNPQDDGTVIITRP